MAKFCETCGKQMEDEVIVCPNCGAQAASANQANQQNGQGDVPPVYNQGGPVYGQPVMPEPQKERVGFAVASMVCGIVSLVFSCCIPWVTFILALVGVILGGVSIATKKGGKGMAIAGLVCSIVALVPAVIMLIAGTAAIADLGGLEGIMNGY